MSAPAAAPAAAGDAALDHLWAGAVVCVLALMGGEILSFERHVIPKELALHAFACSAAVVWLLSARRLRFDVVDTLLAGFLLLGVVSAAAAENGWFALRGAGLTLSATVLFWTARALASEGRSDTLLRIAAVMTVLVAVTALLEAYGMVPGLSTLGRAPGGTIGNRNRMAHLLAAGLPVLLLCAVTARSAGRRGLLALGVALVFAALVLSRCRAAWLALGVMAAAAALWTASGGRITSRGRAGWRRGVLPAAAAGAGIALALLLPNALGWSSASPYADTLRGMADYESGSGRGRLIQWATTLRMAGDHPALGVGPGNWTIHYPRYASPDDPSLSSETMLPTTRLPQGDWTGIAAERGFPALALLALAAGILLVSAWRLRRGPAAPHGLVLVLHLAAVATLGALDPVLLTPAAAFLVFLTVGALAPPLPRARELSLHGGRRWVAAVAVAGLLAVPIVYSSLQFFAARSYRYYTTVERLARATRLDPGDYRAHLLLGEAWIRAGRCDRALRSLSSAHALFPTASAPARLRAGCAPGVAKGAQGERVDASGDRSNGDRTP